MIAYGLPALATVLAWWAATGVVLLLVGLDRALRPWLAAGAALATLGGLAGLHAVKDETGLLGAYVGFGAALLVWGGQEVAFLAGWITGPSRSECPAGLGTWARAVQATRAILYHELALVAAGLCVAAASFGGTNTVGAWTFWLLFAMRISAKLNIFLGVPNITDGFLPPEVAHLKSYFARRPMNGLFPVSVTAATVAGVLLLDRAWGEGEAGPAAAATMLATLVALALLEHWFLVLPIRVEALWGWGVADPQPAAPVVPELPATAANIIRLDRLGVARMRPGPGRTAPAIVSPELPVRRAEPVSTATLRPNRSEHVWGQP